MRRGILLRRQFLTHSGDSLIHHNLAWIGHRIEHALADAQWLTWPLLLGCAVLGVIALASPSCFRAIAANSARWVDTNKFLQKLDTPINIDPVVLRHTRMFGLAVLVASLFWSYLFWLRISGS